MRWVVVVAAALACALSFWPGLEDMSLGVAVMIGFAVICIYELLRR